VAIPTSRSSRGTRWPRCATALRRKAICPLGKTAGVAVRRLFVAPRSQLKNSSFLVFNQQFLTLIKAGLPILSSLDLLIKRQKDANLRQVLENVRERVKGGELLSDAFAAHPMVPKDLYHHPDGRREEREHR